MSKTLKVHITGEATIYRNDKWGYPVYSAKLSTQIDGTWYYDYIQVKIPSGQELQNGTEIKINDGFFSFFSRKDGTKEKYIKIQSYNILNQAVGEIDIPTNEYVDNGGDDLPF